MIVCSTAHAAWSDADRSYRLRSYLQMSSNAAACCLQDEPNWHRADTDKYESEGEGELYEFGQESLDRLALALGGNTVAPLASSLLPTLLQDPDWKKRHAALICISQIAEGCVKVLVKTCAASPTCACR